GFHDWRFVANRPRVLAAAHETPGGHRMALECPPSEPHALVSHVAHGRAPIGRPTALDGTRLSRGQMVRVEAAASVFERMASVRTSGPCRGAHIIKQLIGVPYHSGTCLAAPLGD